MRSSKSPKRNAASSDLAGRRRFLRGCGAALSLPAFESIVRPKTVMAAPRMAASESGAPLRMGFVYIPNGVQQAHWWPSGEGRSFDFNATMKPLEDLRDKVQVFGGLDHQHAESGPDGAGDHARANATFLTGVRARKTSGSNIHLGVSIDQLVAERIGHLTRLPSLELTCDSVRKSGRCDSGYSCAYQYNLSWQSETSPMTPEPNPRAVFERLFGTQDSSSTIAARQATRRSVLDFVLEDAASLKRQLGQEDERKLEEYLSGVRDVEKRISHAEKFGPLPEATIPAPQGIPSDYGEHIAIMFELLALAYQTDSTRVATVLLAHDGSNLAFPQLGVPEGHHYLSHHQDVEEYCKKIAQIDLFYMQHFAAFLQRLDSLRDVDGRTVLENSMIVYGGGNSDGNKHTHTNLPVILAGTGGGQLEVGRYEHFGSVPMCNLFLSMLDTAGIHGVESFGDSTDRLGQI